MYQGLVDRGIRLLEKLAAERGNAIDRTRLSVTDLGFLADLPASASGLSLNQRSLTAPQARQLYELLDRASILRQAA